MLGLPRSRFTCAESDAAAMSRSPACHSFQCSQKSQQHQPGRTRMPRSSARSKKWSSSILPSRRMVLRCRSRTRSNCCERRTGSDRKSMSCDQPPPRTRIGLPLTRNSRAPCGFNSEVISRIPKRTDWWSVGEPFATKRKVALCKGCAPKSAGHHICGSFTVNFGSVTDFVSPGCK